MSDTPEIRVALDRLTAPVAVEPDWGDVLRRAERRAGPFTRRGLVLALAVAALVPAIAAASIHLFGGQPRLVASAQISDSQLGVSASFSGHPARSFSHPGSRRVIGFTRDIEWALTLDAPAGKRVRATLAYPRQRVTLCNPCGASAHGRIGARGAWIRILGGRARLLIAVDGHRLSARVRLGG